MGKIRVLKMNLKSLKTKPLKTQLMTSKFI